MKFMIFAHLSHTVTTRRASRKFFFSFFIFPYRIFLFRISTFVRNKRALHSTRNTNRIKYINFTQDNMNDGFISSIPHLSLFCTIFFRCVGVCVIVSLFLSRPLMVLANAGCRMWHGIRIRQRIRKSEIISCRFQRTPPSTMDVFFPGSRCFAFSFAEENKF